MKFTPAPKYPAYRSDGNHQQSLVWGLIRPFFFGILAALGALFLELIIGMLVGSPQDLNTIFIGLGFSFIELAFIFFSLPSIKDALTLKLAISGILIIHTATSAIMGYLLAKYESAKYVVIPTILIAAVFIHL